MVEQTLAEVVPAPEQAATVEYSVSGDEIEQALRWPAGTWDIIRKPTT